MKKTYIIFFLLISLSACGELVNISGILINRLNASDNRNFEIIIIVKSLNGQLVSGFKISVTGNNDSLPVFPLKITDKDFPVCFNYPDEQINVMSNETTKLVITAEHPELGFFRHEAELSAQETGKPLVIEINTNF